MGVEPFRDNWSYLKVEMTWLERILLNAVAKARATEAKMNRHTKTPADRASRDWWEGLMNFEKVGYDSPPPLNPKPTQSYQQQLEARIQESQAAGVSLVLPMLCNRYGLSLFERQTVLLAIAPEVHRRYGELCGYLSGQGKQGLPTVDLALRLFCRDDRAWRLGRSQLLTGALVTEGILIPFLLPSQSFLQQPLKLNPHWVSELFGTQTVANTSVANPVEAAIGAAAERSVVSFMGGRKGIEPFPAPLAHTQVFKTIPDQIPDFIFNQCQQMITRLRAVSWTGQAVLCVGLDPLLACQSKNLSALSWHGSCWYGFYESIAKTLNLEPHHLDLTVLNLSDFNLSDFNRSDFNRSDFHRSEWSNLSHDRALSQSLSNSEPELTDSDQPSSQVLIIQSAHLLLRRKASLTRLEKVKFIEQMRSRYRLILLDSAYPIALEQVWRSWIRMTITLPFKPVRSTQSRANDS